DDQSALGFHARHQRIETRVERRGDVVAIEVGVDLAGVVADQIDQDETRDERVIGELGLGRKKQRIQEKLKQMPLQFLRPVECFQLEIEVNRLHFLDADEVFRGVDRESVDPA